MQIIHVPSALPASVTTTIFLAGPTPRKSTVQSWRPEAIAHLRRLGYTGAVLVPEPQDGEWPEDYEDQLQWELSMRRAADMVVFWVPRELETMPAFTTNVEFGADFETGKALYGRPDAAPKNRYLDHLWESTFGVAPYSDLGDLLGAAVERLQIDGAPSRRGGERQVPLFVWRTASFQRWHTALAAAGNRLDAFRLLLSFPAHPAGGAPFIWIAHATVWIAAEARHKGNEIVVARPDLSIVVPIHRPGTPEARTVLVSEFRTPVRNAAGMVFEPPGGSSKRAKDERLIAIDELHEETGILLADPGRLVALPSRQIAATLASHHAHVFALELSDEEMRRVETHAAQGTVLGVDAEERTTVIISRVATLGDQPLDWASMGMVLAAEKILAG